MKTCKQQNLKKTPSPWIEKDSFSIFRHEFQLAEDNLEHPDFLPNKLFVWLRKQNGEKLLFRALDRLAPLFPVLAYHGYPALWISPPPSGAGNVILIVMGRDIKGKLRLVGGNYFNEPRRQDLEVVNPADFFDKYDLGNDWDKHALIYNTAAKSLSNISGDVRFYYLHACSDFHTMPIYLVVLTGKENLIALGPAVVEGCRPADFSYEFLGEIQ